MTQDAKSQGAAAQQAKADDAPIEYAPAPVARAEARGLADTTRSRAPGRGRRLTRWIIGGILVVLLLGLGAGWWLAGHRIWTDDRTVHVADGQQPLRQVLWNPPIALGAPFDSDQQQYEPCVSADGTEIYFVRGKPGHNADIYVSYRRNNAWTKPEPLAAVNTRYDELGPRLTADGKFLLFYSDRPGGYGGYDIWACPRTASGWGKAFNLGPSVNSEFNEFTPDPTPDGKHLIFATNRTSAKREQIQAWRATVRENEAADYDLWIADLKEQTDGTPINPEPAPATQPVVPTTQPANYRAQAATAATQPAFSATQPAIAALRSLMPATQPADIAVAGEPRLVYDPAREIPGINTPYVEGASCMSPAGDFLYFASNRPGGFGKFDIWRCRVTPDWKFGTVENAGAGINTADNETDPAMALNGYRMVFSSDRGNDRGVYHLLSSDSREVYSVRQGRPLPHFGMSLWLLLGSLIVLLPLLFFLRGWDDRRLGLLQKCLLLSLLAHVLLCLALSFIWVSSEAFHYVRQQMGVEVAINLNASPELQIGSAIRRQSTSDLPSSGAAPEQIQQTATPLETLVAPGPVNVALPRAEAMTDPIASASDLQVSQPKIESPTIAPRPTAPQVQLPSELPPAIHDIQTAARLTQAEAKPNASRVSVAVNRATVNEATGAPRTIDAPAAPSHSVAPSPLTADAAPAIEPKTPADLLAQRTPVAPSATNLQQTAPVAPQLPQTIAKVSGTDAAPTIANPPDAATGAKMTAQRAASALAGAGPRANVAPAVTPVLPNGTSGGIASAAPPSAFHLAGGAMVAGTAPAAAAELSAAPNPQMLKPSGPVGRLASGSPQAPGAREANVAMTRQSIGVIGGASASIQAGAPRAAMTTTSSLTDSAALNPAQAVKAITAGPTTMPSSAIAQRLAAGPAVTPTSEAAAPKLSAAPANAERALASASSPGPTTRPSAVLASAAPSPLELQAPLGSSRAAEKTEARRTESDGPLVSDPGALFKRGDPPISVAGTAAPASIPGALTGPNIAAPPAMAALPARVSTPAGGVAKPAQPIAAALASKQALHGMEGGGSRNVAVDIPGPVTASLHLPGEPGKGLDPISVAPRPTAIMVAPVPDVSVALLPGDIGPGALRAPDSPFEMRAPEVHEPIIEKLGGTKQSEEAVARALRWLADWQEEDGRWTMIYDSRHQKHPRSQHDMALTGFPVLAFLAQDHRPDKPGPYRQTVARALDYLISQQLPDGDLRGPMRGEGADQGNMYDHGIAAYALAEAALMTHDPKYVDAAIKAAQFIVGAQDQVTGGWRYAPRQQGDSSVFGWQVMALRSAQRLGFEIPDRTRAGIERYMRLASSGRHHMLAGYLPHSAPSPAMTAQLAFSRMLMGQRLDDEEMAEASDYLSRQPPDEHNPDVYYWYYASLCMSQMRTAAWDAWNARTRDMLIAMQHREGAHSGYWDTRFTRADRAGRVFSTSMAALTLEVYYRYMPMQTGAGEGKTAKSSE